MPRAAVIVSAVRTPIGAFLGSLAELPAPRLGAIAIAEAIRRASIEPHMVDEVIMGNVLTAGVGQAPARQAALFAGLPDHVPCTTINKVCGSGLKAVMLAEQSIRCGDADIVVAGGQESMSNAPYLLPKVRTGLRMGNAHLIDSMIYDGLWDVYNQFHMGAAAELCARSCNISRHEQDEYAALSYHRALEAQAQGYFADEIVPVTYERSNGQTVTIDQDEEPAKVRFEKIPHLKPVFQPDGTITAANASSIDDGAAALVIMSEERAADLELQPLARIVAHGSVAQRPEWFTTAPIEGIRHTVRKAGLSLEDIDLFEINEAFAVVALVAQKELDIPLDRLNVHGGAVALGHPIGASGARILTTLLYALRRYRKRYGMVAICIGGGEASALIVENLQ